MRAIRPGADCPPETVRPARTPLRLSKPDLSPKVPPDRHPSEWSEWTDLAVWELGPDAPDVDLDRDRWEPGAELPLFPSEERSDP